MLGVMLTTAFLSMWISNTATTALMLPIVDAIVEALEGKDPLESQDDDEEQKKAFDKENLVRKTRHKIISAQGNEYNYSFP